MNEAECARFKKKAKKIKKSQVEILPYQLPRLYKNEKKADPIDYTFLNESNLKFEYYIFKINFIITIQYFFRY